MDISIYFKSIKPWDEDYTKPVNKKRLGGIIKSYFEGNYFPELDNVDIAIIGVKEGRKSIGNPECELAPDYVRQNLYRLFPPVKKVKIADLGNISSGETIEDTYFAIKEVVASLIKAKILPVIIGGGQDLTYANYLAYESLGQIVNIVTIDPAFDIGKSEKNIHSRSYLGKIILHQPNYLFNYTNIGYQTYFVDQDAIELMKNLYFDAYRLGMVRDGLEGAEPLIRNADILSFDISVIRQSDAPGNANASPNGFYGEEACQMLRYAGLSEKVTSLGIYELNPILDNNQQTSQLVAQMLWYFIEGYYNRKQDFPFTKKENYIKYVVTFKGNENNIIFYKSKKSDRWWMEVPCSNELKNKFERHYLVPCSYEDYKMACQEEIPEKWWQTMQKLM